MRVLILCYSRTGNNRLLASHLAEQIAADFEEVRTKGWRTFLSIIRNLSRDREPWHMVGERRALTGKITVVWAKRVQHDELSAFQPQIGAILRWFAPDKVESPAPNRHVDGHQ